MATFWNRKQRSDRRTTLRHWALRSLLGFPAAVLTIYSLTFSAQAQDNQPAAAGNQPAAGEAHPLYVGFEECGDCHATPNRIKATDFITKLETRRFLTEESDQELINEIRAEYDEAIGAGESADNPAIELSDESKRDKHALAFSLLTGELGQRICKTLDIQALLVADDKKIDQTKWQDGPAFEKALQCLRCHSGPTSDAFHQLQASNPSDEVGEAQLKHLQNSIVRGVTCEACHGPGEKYHEPHQQPESWRLKTPADKTALGMIDVRNPVSKAEQCMGCHIGSPDEGKMVTHDMYAAGHPPLPSFELDTFTRQMPLHWRTVREKGNFQFRTKYVAANYPGRSEDEVLADLPQTKTVLVGAVLALKYSLNLVAKRAETVPDQWPELAAFDCGACHHDLRAKSWRQDRGYVGRPGRPQPADWSTALVKAAIYHVAGDDAEAKKQHTALEQQLVAFREVLDKHPFGDPKELPAAAQTATEYLDKLAQQIQEAACTAEHAGKILQVLTEDQKLRDYHGARQIVWATQTIHAEVASQADFPADLPAASVEVKQRIKDTNAQIATWRKSFHDSEAAFTGLIDKNSKLNGLLYLNLPAGQSHEISVELPENLKKISDYDARQFKAGLAELHKELNK